MAFDDIKSPGDLIRSSDWNDQVTYIKSVIATSGVVQVVDGSVSNPSFSFINDTDTGLFSANSNSEIGFSVGGTEVSLLDGSGNFSVIGALSATGLDTGQGENELYAMDQAVQTTDQPTFAGLTVNGRGMFNTDDGADKFYISRKGAIDEAIAFSVTDGGANIQLIQDSDNDGAHSLTIETTSVSSGDDIITLRTNGNNVLNVVNNKVGIGTASPSSPLEVNGTITINTNTDYKIRIQDPENTNWNIVTAGNFLIGEEGQSYRFMIEDSTGYVGIGTISPTEKLDINSDAIRIRTSSAPASATATGAVGEIRWDANYIYVCTATNTWKRTAISTW